MRCLLYALHIDPQCVPEDFVIQFGCLEQRQKKSINQSFQRMNKTEIILTVILNRSEQSSIQGSL